MPDSLPQVLHTYQNHHLDSTRWDAYVPRDDDVIIATPYKSGTTWTMNIVRRLIFLGQEILPYRELWLDARFRGDLDEVIAELEGQTHRHYIKTHLPLDGLPFFSQAKYIVVGRDPRDVFMSLWNHYHALYERGAFEYVNHTLPGRVGPPIPAPPNDIHDFWRDWIGRGWFAWEKEGYPWWSNLHHVQTWWEYRHLNNILFLHYNDLKADLAAEVRRIASFIDIEVSEEELPELLQALSLEAMRKESEAEAETPEERTWAQRFFFKGTNGRWRDVLTKEELEQYEQKANEVLSPECKAWLEGKASSEGS